MFALAYAGCALAMVGFLAGSDGGLDWLGADFDSPRDRSRFKNLLLACSSLALACAAAPAGAAQWAARKGRNPHGLGVDARRIRETAAGALGATMLGGTLLLLGFVASKRNRTADFSYFKTSVPGEAVQEIVRNLDGQLRTVLFFPEVNSVKDELVDYFRALGRATDNVVLETYDRFEEPALSARVRRPQRRRRLPSPRRQARAHRLSAGARRRPEPAGRPGRARAGSVAATGAGPARGLRDDGPRRIQRPAGSDSARKRRPFRQRRGPLRCRRPRIGASPAAQRPSQAVGSARLRLSRPERAGRAGATASPTMRPWS